MAKKISVDFINDISVQNLHRLHIKYNTRHYVLVDVRTISLPLKKRIHSVF